jgi:hypothetical protein
MPITPVYHIPNVPQKNGQPTKREELQAIELLTQLLKASPRVRDLVCWSLLAEDDSEPGLFLRTQSSCLEQANEWSRKVSEMMPRKKARNSERDDEVMRLYNQGSTAGQIALELRGRWSMTAENIRRIISSRKAKNRR